MAHFECHSCICPYYLFEDNPLPSTNHPPPDINHPPPDINHPPPATNFPPPGINHSLLGINHPPPATKHSPTSTRFSINHPIGRLFQNIVSHLPELRTRSILSFAFK